MFWKKKHHHFFTKEEEAQIIEAIRLAESCTSGEIRVHIQHFLEGNVLADAAKTFKRLKMDATALNNGVLFFIAPDNKKFAIIGDKGIDAKVPEGFWTSIKDEMESAFMTDQFVKGITHAIEETGQQLAQYFPIQDDDINELPDEISYS